MHFNVYKAENLGTNSKQSYLLYSMLYFVK